MKKNKLNVFLYIAMFLIAGLFIFLACRRSNQAIMAIPIPIEFVGEYSQNGEEWRPISDEINLSSYRGDLVLRGKFELELPEGIQIQFYLNHIGMSLFINGENVYQSSSECHHDMCGINWASWMVPAITSDDIIEIHLNNPHSYGNKNAYNEFLNSTYICNEMVLKDFFESNSRPNKIICAFIFVASITLIGTAIGYRLLNLPNSSLLLKLGCMAILMGLYMYFDSMDVPFQNNKVIFNTYMRQYAIMFTGWMLCDAVLELFKEKEKEIAVIAIHVLIFADFIFMILAFKGWISIYDTAPYWAIVQGLVSLILFILGIMYFKKSRKQERMILVPTMALLPVLILELINFYTGWWGNSIFIKTVFTVIFAFMFVIAIITVAKNYQESIRAKKLESELRDSQLTLAFSQIQPHFLYNTLSTVGVLCKKEPVLASEAIDVLADYMRVNLDSVDQTLPVTFTKELNHVRSYLWLEKMRFGDDLQIHYDFQTENFMLPILTVQPIVENAVHHGMMGREGVCHICIRTRELDNSYEVVIEDDGIGFNTQEEKADGKSHVGIRNVRNRLEKMVGGALIIESEKGKGTKVTIKIPKENEDENSCT